MDVSMHPTPSVKKIMEAAPKTSEKRDSKAEALLIASQAYARKTIDATFEGSAIEDKADEFPKFDRSELKLGKVLGKGGFCTVYEVKGFSGADKPPKASRGGAKDDEQVDEGQKESRKFIADHCLRKGGDARYAVKLLSPETIKETALFIQGIMDMAVETRVLSSFLHPNIVKLRAVAVCDPYQTDYYIVLDRLYDTLEKKIDKWAARDKRPKLFDRKGKKANELLEERMTAAFDLSAALEHIHEKGVIYRDLKPENLGFDIRDDIKIFDFGLAKELRDKDKLADGTYKLTEYTGSPRYMAPEVALAKPYHSSCDVYSFAILLWEIMAMRKPFESYTVKSLTSKVWEGGRRPQVDEKWTVTMQLLLKRSWSEDINERHRFENITKLLRKECVRCRGGDDSGLEHQRRRSTFVFRKKK